MKNTTAHRIQMIRALFPEAREADLVARLEQFKKIADHNKENSAVSGKNQDYRQGYDLGQFMNESGEDDYDFKDLDQLANEIYDETDWQDLPFQDLEAFKDGLANGYTIPEHWQNQQDR
jgi:hypothetical protein